MRKFSAAVLVLLLLAVSTVWLRAQESAEKVEEKKTFRVESATVNLGVVHAGDDGVATYVFRNDTDKDVRIIRAKPG